ncbi:hypothetical protein [Microbacterium laevaniformans]|uniref:hypothetical protein n=1 Tax=Microbacterium laevaniformans TaxID=36807 RepID=UPI00363848CB
MRFPRVIAPFALAALAVGASTSAASAASAATTDDTPAHATSTHARAASRAPHVTSSSTLADDQAAGAALTAARITALTAEIAKITADTSMSDTDRSAALSTMNTDLAAMKTLQSTIAADTDAAKALADVRSVDRDYRVMSVVIPQVRLAARADRLTGRLLPRAEAAQKRLQSRLDAASAGSGDAASAMSDLSTQLPTVQKDTDGVATAALAVTPSAFNANHAVLFAVRSTLTSARTAATAAVHDLGVVRSALHKK